MRSSRRLAAGASQTTLRCASLTSWDALAGGALVALLLQEHGSEWLRSRRLLRALPWVGVPLIGLGMMLLFRGSAGGARSSGELFLITLKSPLMIWLVASAAMGFRGPLGRLLSTGVMQRLGTVWIGLYLFHAFAPLTRRVGPIGSLPWPLLMLVYAAFTISAASLAYLMIERPLRRWADRRLAPTGAITPEAHEPRQAA